MQQPLAQLLEAMTSYVREHPDNALAAHAGMRIYDPPVLAVAHGQDPLFGDLKEERVVGAHHRSPREWLASAQRVLVYFLPFSLEVRQTNRQPGLPSEEWASARIDGEAFSVGLRRHLVQLLRAWGEQAVAPSLEPGFAVTNRRANWSERHVAFIAGLGSFGLSSSFITTRGSAGRLGSLVTSLVLPVTARQSEDLHYACPWYTQSQACGECLDRCPAQAITPEGKDVGRCAAYLDIEVRPRFAPRYGCAKCQVGVRCEAQTP